MLRLTPISTLFPYTTLFRSRTGSCDRPRVRDDGRLAALEDGDSRVGGSEVDADRTCHGRSEEHTSELQSQFHLVCRLLLEKKNTAFPPYSTRHLIISNSRTK